MIKIFAKYSVFFFIFFFESINASDENKIVVKIDKKIVSSYEIKNKINTKLILRNLEITQSNIDRMKKIAVQELINFRIKEKEISKYSAININEMDVPKQLNSLSSNNIEELKKKFLINNLNYDTFVKELKIQASWQKLIFLLFNDKVKINENEILNEVNNIKSNILKNKEYDISELELSFLTESEKNKKIEEIQKKIIENGFENSVSIYSESETAIDNGRLGLINEKSLSKEFVKILKDLKEGQVSEPIIKLNKITFFKINKIQNSQNENLDIEILKKDITDKKKNDLFNLYSKSHLSKLKNNSYIEFK